MSTGGTRQVRRTFCRVCHAACPLDVEVADNRVLAVHGVPEDPLFEGYTCIKGRQLPDQIHHPARLSTPLRRSGDGTFAPIGSEAALDEIAAALWRIVDTHGPRAVANYTGTGGYQSASGVPSARAFHQGLGSPSIYTSVTIDQPAKTTAPLRLGVWEAGYHGFRDADVVMALGYNPMVSSYGPVGGLQGTNPFTVLRRAQRRGMKLVVVDPRRTELGTRADVHLQIRPGEDPTLLAAMINVVLTEGLADEAFCDRWVDQLDDLARAVAPVTPDDAAQHCGVAVEDLLRATRLFAAGPRGTGGTGTGPNMAPHSSLTEHLTLVLNTILGRVNREGDRVESGWFLYPEAPRRAQVLPPRDPTTGPAARIRGLRGYRGEMPTATLAEEILTPGEGRIRALLVSGGNPAVAWPDQALTLRALRDLELLVVLDHRLTATAELADYVLPAKLSLERADVPHLMDRWWAPPYTNYTPAIVAPAGDVVSEWEMFWGLACRLGVPLRFPGGDAPTDRTPSDDEILDLVYAGSRMPLDEVRAHRGVIHEDRSLVVAPADSDATARFAVAPPDVVAELAAVRVEASSGPTTRPFRLVSRRLKHALNSLGPELPELRAKGTTNYAYLHPDDLDEIGAADGDLVEINSPHGSLAGVARSSPAVRRGVVSMAHSWGGASLTDEAVRDIGSPTNRLVSTTTSYDPITGMAVQSAIPVSVHPAEQEP